MNATGLYWWLVNIGSGNGLVPSGTLPLPEPVLAQFLSPYGVARPQWVKMKVTYRSCNYNLNCSLLNETILITIDFCQYCPFVLLALQIGAGLIYLLEP